ncbi:MAG: hypothetical protein JSR45_12490 [Proteobacteria bacterium]|nr:hypothetical protein [Pseudomonadota bacterium]
MSAARDAAIRSWRGGALRRALQPRRCIPARDEAGFVAVDALVALAILSATVALSIRTADTARRTASLAVETREAQAVLEQVLESPVRSPGSISGRSGAFDWKLVISPLPLATGSSQADRLCQRTVEVRRGDDARMFRASTVRACPPQEGVL